LRCFLKSLMYRSDPRSANNEVCVVLAVYNGQHFIEQQLDSICSQKYQDWDLFIRDDASRDASLSIVENFAKKNSHVDIIEDLEGNLGAKKSFVSLLESKQLESYSYVAFSDQDDVWMQDKLLRQLEEMYKLEGAFPNTPLLVYSDMEVVDASLDMISSSFMDYQGIHHEDKQALQVLLTQNFSTGCTMLVNRKLLDIALPMPDDVLMHDWWLALCAAVFGSIGFIDEPLLKYRQHGNNEVGAKHLSDFLNPRTGAWKQRWLDGQKNLFQSMKQAEALAERIRERDPHNLNLALVEDYAALQNLSGVQRIKKIKLLGIHAQSKTRQLLLLSRLLLSPSSNHG